MSYITAKDIHLIGRSPKSHKGDNGKVLIIGGSEQYTGCLALAGIAALRSGCDWVTVVAPEKVGWAVSALSPDLIVHKLSGSCLSPWYVRQLVQFSEDFDVVLLGTGMTKESDSFIKRFAARVNKPLVLDARALHVLKLQEIDQAVFTPHQRELEELLENSQIEEKHIQKHIGSNIIVAKGAVDTIISFDERKKNRTGNAGMSVAGTGDVLAGLITGFIAQGYPLFQAACYGTYFAGKAGDLLKKKKGYTYIASDLARELALLINQKNK